MKPSQRIKEIEKNLIAEDSRIHGNNIHKLGRSDTSFTCEAIIIYLDEMQGEINV